MALQHGTAVRVIAALQAGATAAAYRLPAASQFATSSSSGGSSVVEVASDSEFTSTLKALAERQSLAIVDFTAKWCGPCKAIAPHFEQLSRQYPQVKFLKIDIDQPALAATVMDHSITGVPTFVVYKGANKLETFTGARLDYLKAVLAKHSAGQ